MRLAIAIAIAVTLAGCPEEPITSNDTGEPTTDVAPSDTPTNDAPTELGPDADETDAPTVDVGDDASPVDTVIDTPPSDVADVPPSDQGAEMDAPADSDLPQDAGSDTGSGDVEPDMGADAGPSDVSADQADAALDVGATDVPADVDLPSLSIADLRAATDNTPLEPALVVPGAVVTYVKPLGALGGNGFFVQSESTGPGIFVYSGDTDAAEQVSEGDVVELTVSGVTTYEGIKQVNVYEVQVTSTGADLVGLQQDLAALSIAPSVETESELLTVTGVLSNGIGDVWTLTYNAGGLEATLVYIGGLELNGACKGMEVTVRGVGSLFNGQPQLQLWRDSDLLATNAVPCAPSDASNWDFESGPDYEPPSGFSAAINDDIGMVDETTDVNTGDHAVGVIWYTTDNWELRANWRPATNGAAGTYRLHGWYLDDDLCGRSRLGIKRNDAEGLQVGNTVYSSYTGDSADWQEVVAEVDTDGSESRLSLFARFYDNVSDDSCYGDPTDKPNTFNGAVLTFDDWALTQPVVFDATDGNVDVLTGSPSSPPELVTGVHLAMNDDGVLYLAGPQAAAPADHVFYAWIGSPSASVSVPAPWAKSGTVAGPGDGVLVALIQEESNLFCEWRVWADGAWATVDPLASACSDNVGGVLEGWVDVTELLASGPTAPAGLPATIGLAIAPYQSIDGGALISESQVPLGNDGNVESDETLTTHRASVLVGRVQ